MRLPLFFLCGALCFGQAGSPSITDGVYQGRKAWVLGNGLIRVSILSGGGHIAETRLITGDPRKDLNPMRVPHYPTIDPHTYLPAQHDSTYGDGPSRWLMSGYMGHLVCFPSYGPPSEAETKAGLGGHGEAPIVEWKQIAVEAKPAAVTLRVWRGLEEDAIPDGARSHAPPGRTPHPGGRVGGEPGAV